MIHTLDHIIKLLIYRLGHLILDPIQTMMANLVNVIHSELFIGRNSIVSVTQTLCVIGSNIVFCSLAALIGLGVMPHNVSWPPYTGDFVLGTVTGLAIGVIGSVIAIIASTDISKLLGRWIFILCIQALSIVVAFWVMSSFASYVRAA